MATRPKLIDHLARKPGDAPAPDAAPLTTREAPKAALRRGGAAKSPIGSAEDGRIGQTLRLSPEGWKQLRLLAIDEMKSNHDLLREAVNMLFTSRGRPPIA